MIIIDLIVARSVREGHWTELRGNVSCVHHEVAKGCFIFINLGEAGLVVTNGKDQVGIPLAEIVRLAQAHHPGLVPQDTDGGTSSASPKSPPSHGAAGEASAKNYDQSGSRVRADREHQSGQERS